MLLPLLLLGLPMPVAAVLAFAIAIQLLLQHSNVDMRPGVLGRVMAWAPLHRFHHMRYGTAGDVNFGAVTEVLGTETATGAVSVRCSKNTPFTLSFAAASAATTAAATGTDSKTVEAAELAATAPLAPDPATAVGTNVSQRKTTSAAYPRIEPT